MESEPATVMHPADIVDALEPVVSAFELLGVNFFIGGSVASSFHVAARSTMDVDVVCDLKTDQVRQFHRQFVNDYYISEPAIRQAVLKKSCFNLIHLPTSWKIDVFISRGRSFDVDSMRRAKVQSLGGTRVIEVPIATAEDSIISKLEWYRLTDETSDR